MSERKYGVSALVLSGILGVILGACAVAAVLRATVTPRLQESAQEVSSALAERDALIASLRAELEEARKPELPLQVAFRGALLGPGYVLVLTNTGVDVLQVRATFKNDFRSATETHEFVIDPQGVKTVGHTEGWAWVKGDTLSLEAPGYKLRAVQVQ